MRRRTRVRHSLRSRTTFAVLAGAAMLLGACDRPESHSLATRPTLVVLIAVDQMRGEDLDQFREQLTGGLRLIRDEGIFFPYGLQNHALPETAPGHASMLSGRYPANTGIFSNDLGVPDTLFPLLKEGTPRSAGASPERFRGTQLFDWIVAADPNATALSVSRKDRSAILMVGKGKENVYWWNTGAFTTSVYYRDRVADWVEHFNESLVPSEWASREWGLLLGESEYDRPDDLPWEGAGRPTTFPHRLPGADSALQRLERWPWIDSITAAFALRGAAELRLGQRGSTDLLAVSFSAMDAIGHDFGPDSREVHDHLLRLDTYIGFFLDSLWRMVPRHQTLIAFTADHGVNPFPEALAARSLPSGKIRLSDLARAAERRLSGEFRRSFGIRTDNSAILADLSALREAGVNVDSLAEELAAALGAREGVARVFTQRSLREASSTDSAAMLWRRQLADGFGWLVVGVAHPGYVFYTGNQADHGTLSPFSRSVPVAFLVSGKVGATEAATVETVDIAPTLAALLGVRPLERPDGRVLDEVVKAAATPDSELPTPGV